MENWFGMVLPLSVSASLSCLHSDSLTWAHLNLPNEYPETLCDPYFKQTSKVHLLIYSQTLIWAWLHDGYYSRLGDILASKTNNGAPLKKRVFVSALLGRV